MLLALVPPPNVSRLCAFGTRDRDYACSRRRRCYSTLEPPSLSLDPRRSLPPLHRTVRLIFLSPLFDQSVLAGCRSPCSLDRPTIHITSRHLAQCKRPAQSRSVEKTASVRQQRHTPFEHHAGADDIFEFEFNLHLQLILLAGLARDRLLALFFLCWRASASANLK